MFKYTTRGVCSRAIELEVENDIITYCRFEGGCNGNTKGIASLIEGMPVEEAIRRMEGIRCGFKSTSCPDQLAQALKEAINQ